LGDQTRLSMPEGVAVDAVHNEIFVTDYNTNSVTVHSRTANGNTAPLRVLNGSLTGLNLPVGVAVDTANNELYVSNAYGSGSITVYSRTASGNVAPTRTLAGNLTLLSGVQGIYYDQPNLELLAATGSAGTGRILGFPRTASGNVAPSRSFVLSYAFSNCFWYDYWSVRGVTVNNATNEIWALVHETYTTTDCVDQVDTLTDYLYAFNRSTMGYLRKIYGANTGLDSSANALATNGSLGEVFVPNYFTNSVIVHTGGLSGNAMPARVISGAATGFSGPKGIVYDATNGELLTVNETANSLTVHAGNATGNAGPSRTVSGGGTVVKPWGLAVSFDRDEVYASLNQTSVAAYSRLATGSTAPLRTLTGFSQVRGLAQNPVSGELFVADQPAKTVKVFPLTAQGAAAPTRTITGVSTGLDALPQAIAVNANRGELAVGTTNSLLVFDVLASGNAAPLRTLQGASTLLTNVEGVAFDTSELWAATTGGSGSLLVFPIAGAGNIAPTRNISGANTKLSSPRGMFIDRVKGEVYVANGGDHSILVFRTSDNGNVAPARIINGPQTILGTPVGLAEAN
jgi:DNA-binding beta-propeller fold protein YncE